jgi:hypothetical protein
MNGKATCLGRILLSMWILNELDFEVRFLKILGIRVDPCTKAERALRAMQIEIASQKSLRLGTTDAMTK